MPASSRLPVQSPSRRLRGLRHVRVLGHRVPVAETACSRLFGLALLERGRAGPGLLIPRCGSVHTFGMRFALDLVFLGRDGAVVEVRREVPPGALARRRRAASVLELVSLS